MAALPSDDPGEQREVPAGDLAYGSFTEHGPWKLDPDHLAWRHGLAEIREAARAAVPELTRPRRVPPGRRVLTTVRRLGIPVAWWALRDRGTDRSVPSLSHGIRVASEHLGPTYIKLLQIISAGEGIFPEALVNEFRLCRDKVRPEPWPAVQAVIEQDLGASIDELFETFDRTPLAAASIAQVHAATLRTGEEVVVKVQRPTVARRVRDDLRVMSWLAPHLVGRIKVSALANPPALVDLFAETITEELDFRLEAENMLDVARCFADLGQRNYVIPRPHPTLVTRRVLVMERLRGFAFSDVAGMKGAGVDTEQVVRTGMIGFMEGALVHGIFHGDLHAGNLFVLPDGRTALMDFGITGRLDEQERHAFLRFMLGASMSDVKTQLTALRDLGALPPDTDIEEVVLQLGLDKPPVDPTQLSADDLVDEMQQMVKSLLGMGARLPKELMLFVKNMVFCDSAIATLAPDIDLLGEVSAIAFQFATKHGEKLAAEIGFDFARWQLDTTSLRAGLGVDDTAEKLTYRDLQQRRELIRHRLEDHRATQRRGPLRSLFRR